MTRKTLFGIGEKGWKAIDVASVGLILTTTVADTASKSKNKRLKKIGKLGMSPKALKTTKQISSGLLIFVLARNLIDAMEEYDILLKKDAIFPGRGLLTDTTATALRQLRPLGQIPLDGDKIRNVF
tara:strand:+ start:819 stop:1196 length:378 start_codon:yes stop_codon:yes gene_type:complete